MATLNEFKAFLKKNDEIAKMIMPSSRNEIYLDFDGAGKIDFAFLGVDGPAYTSSTPSKEIEDVVAPAVEKITNLLRAEWNAESVYSAIKDFKDEVIAALKAYQESKA